MSGALRYLTAISLRNRWRAQLRRLRQPRYAIALVLGVAYIWTFLLRPQPRPSGGASPLLGADARSLAELGVLMLVAGAWLFAGGKLALAFAPAEVDFLFPAPLTRRQLVVYKLLRAQLVVGFNTLLWVFILRRGGSELSALIRAVTMWVFFTTLYLHRVGAGLARAAWVEHGRAGVRKQRLTTVAFVAVVGALVWSAVRAAPGVAASSRGTSVLGSVVAATRAAPASWVLAPLRWTLAPAFAHTVSAWTRAIGPAVVLLALNAVWVLSADVAFEEAAAEASRERVRRLEALRNRRAGPAAGKARFRGVIPLAPVGRAEAAILWKNLLAFVRTVQVGRLVGVLAFGVIAALIASDHGAEVRPAQFVAVLAITTAALLVILGPRVVRNDLRMDMASLELVKAFPLGGRAIVAAEIAASLAVLVALQAALVVVAYAAYLADPVPLPAGFRAAYLAAAPVGAVCLDALALTAQNAAAVLLPSWVQTGSVVGGGVELLGQNLLTTLAMLLVVILALVPPALLAGAAVVLAQRVAAGQGVALGAGVVVVLGAVALELWLTVRWLGGALERAEPAVTGGVA